MKFTKRPRRRRSAKPRLEIRRPFLGCVEGDSALWIVVFAGEHVVDDVLQVGLFFVGLTIRGPESAEMVEHDMQSRRIWAQGEVLDPRGE
jgi:hypothetical protein